MKCIKQMLRDIYAIGDVAGPPLLAHAACHEGVVAAEHLAGKNPHAIDPTEYSWLYLLSASSCFSVGYTRELLKRKSIKYNVGKLPFYGKWKSCSIK